MLRDPNYRDPNLIGERTRIEGPEDVRKEAQVIFPCASSLASTADRLIYDSMLAKDIASQPQQAKDLRRALKKLHAACWDLQEICDTPSDPLSMI